MKLIIQLVSALLSTMSFVMGGFMAAGVIYSIYMVIR